jgi:putative spermidine/putrescine transport system ATP-binding protein
VSKTAIAHPEMSRTMPASKARAARQPLSLRNLSHRYGSAPVLDNVSLDIAEGTIAALLGPSGCGKTTILRAIAGLIRPDAGTISLGERRLDLLPTRQRRVGLVFQSYALFPHMTVRENVAYGLAQLGRAERRARVNEMLALVRLDAFADRLPRELSGGQQQRAAVARALAARPDILLLDEPFAALDKDLRLDLQIELSKLQKRFGITTVLVTHDQEEALSIADQVMVMRAGRIEQQGAPTEVYDAPQTLFVNLFVGRASVLTAVVLDTAGRVRIQEGPEINLGCALPFSPGTPVAICARPEHVAFCDASAPGAIPATLIVSLPLGATTMHEAALSDGTPLKVSTVRHGLAMSPHAGEQVHLRLDPLKIRVFPAASTSTSPAK